MKNKPSKAEYDAMCVLAKHAKPLCQKKECEKCFMYEYTNDYEGCPLSAIISIAEQLHQDIIDEFFADREPKNVKEPK